MESEFRKRILGVGETISIIKEIVNSYLKQIIIFFCSYFVIEFFTGENNIFLIISIFLQCIFVLFFTFITKCYFF